jgi:hypothetical protein
MLDRKTAIKKQSRDNPAVDNIFCAWPTMGNKSSFRNVIRKRMIGRD